MELNQQRQSWKARELATALQWLSVHDVKVCNGEVSTAPVTTNKVHDGSNKYNKSDQP